MQNSQIALRIKSLCIERKMPIDKLLRDCNIRRGLIYDMKKETRLLR